MSNPYLNARRAWNTHTATLMQSIKLWQAIGLISLMITFASVSGIIYIGSQSKFVPLVFKEDASHNILSVTRADNVPKAQDNDYKIAAVNFIENIRLVTADINLQRQAVLNTYAYLMPNDAATKKAGEYLNGSSDVNPFVRAKLERVYVEILSVLKQSQDSWQVDWLENIRSIDGSLKKQPVKMRAIVNLYQVEANNHTTESDALKNPHLIFVRDFNWSKTLG